MLVRLAHDTDLAGFRREARALLARRVRPEDVFWSTGPCHDDLFAGEPAPEEPVPEGGVTVPTGFLELCHDVVLHSEPQRFALLYRLLWRLVHEPSLRHDPLDPDMLHARDMAKAVRRDIHKMHAFVRFRQVQDGDDALDPLHVAWFEPEHHIVEANAPWFRRRFANMRWAILTPRRCVEWDRRQLHFRGGASRDEAPPPDAGEALWLTYYQSIFNPARLKLKMMQKEMPRRYWRNLPEAQLIAPLAATAQERSALMIEQPATVSTRRIPRFPEKPLPIVDPGGLVALNGRLERCRECPIGAAATQAVPGEGPLQPAVMFVGEQPGEQEDLRGRPFVGPAGQLFDRALQQLGVARETVYVTNAVRHFKFELRGKRRIHKTPTQQEALACRHWLDEEIALVQPKKLVALGATAARALLGRPVAVLTERGEWFERPDGLRVLVTLHPSALLRMEESRQEQGFEGFVRDLGRVWAG
ncbi:UdgX family uracil-DNA binding protein [Ramlibacter sp. USB13]|uniref:Type-4 uracil-DNA glycosylase n=1 Tax=Ramlibacter cellulosilyticus TaxID=2764187 RepID=A0A923S9W6_9BURK|nr:UdgX family uracil-DNA binding protein [Ramlibacter cellulosilyticus]MBC5782110.1 UdgX family uracil-DNA binding protein [Ramlibacter cellulosilyticus]